VENSVYFSTIAFTSFHITHFINIFIMDSYMLFTDCILHDIGSIKIYIQTNNNATFSSTYLWFLIFFFVRREFIKQVLINVHFTTQNVP